LSFVHATWALYRFECIRTATIGRQLMWAGLASFPIAIMLAVRLVEARARGPMPPEMWGATLYFLVPGIFCVLGLLTSVTPLLQSELEGKTWTYLSVRPGARFAVIIGKYLAGITWTIPFGLISCTFCILIGSQPEAARLWLVMSSLIILAALTYGAIFALFGVINPRRATVVAVIYAIVSEIVVASIPAVVQRFTVVFHLRQLLYNGMEWTGMRTVTDLNSFHHVGALLATTVLCLVAAVLILRQRELIANPEE